MVINILSEEVICDCHGIRYFCIITKWQNIHITYEDTVYQSIVFLGTTEISG